LRGCGLVCGIGIEDVGVRVVVRLVREGGKRGWGLGGAPRERLNGMLGPQNTPSRRREQDVMKLLMTDYKVEMGEDGALSEFHVEFHGPRESPYEGGVWRVHVELPLGYPYKSPAIGFVNKIFHPNVDACAGSVCLDVINQTWSPMFDLVNIFEVFLPQLLLYPNPADPLNGEAAALMMHKPADYRAKVKEYVALYASPAAAAARGGLGGRRPAASGASGSGGAGADDDAQQQQQQQQHGHGGDDASDMSTDVASSEAGFSDDSDVELL